MKIAISGVPFGEVRLHVIFSSALEKIIVSGYKALNLIYFFTAGEDEVKAWPVQVISFPNPCDKLQANYWCRDYLKDVFGFEKFIRNEEQLIKFPDSLKIFLIHHKSFCESSNIYFCKFFTWLFFQNSVTKAPQAAGKIHTDFEAGFIMAEVMHFEDFKEAGSESAAKAQGKYRQQGKNYIVEDGDIKFFKFNAGAGLSGKKK